MLNKISLVGHNKLVQAVALQEKVLGARREPLPQNVLNFQM